MHLKKCDQALYISFIYKLLYKNTYVNLSIDNHLKICHNRLFYDTTYNFDLHSAPHTPTEHGNNAQSITAIEGCITTNTY